MDTCDSCSAGGEPIYAGEAVFWCSDCGNGFCEYCAADVHLDDETIYCDHCYDKQNAIARSKSYEVGVLTS